MNKKSQIKISAVFLLSIIVLVILCSVFFAYLWIQKSKLINAQIISPPIAKVIVNPSTNLPESFLELDNKNTELAFRSRLFDFTSEVNNYESKGYGYFVTAASSDYTHFQGASFYQSINILQNVAVKPSFRGFYFQEMLTHLAAVNGWKWSVAHDSLDWNWVDQVVMLARQNGKKVVWSEPTYAWKTLATSSKAATYFAKWGDTLVPMYATNFTDVEIASAKQYSMQVASTYNLEFGQSHQAWYFRDFGRPITAEASYNLAIDAWNSGARYFQFEGTATDMSSTSPYLLGIKQFATFIGGISSPSPSLLPTPSPKPCPWDVNGDRVVNSLDLKIVNNHKGETGGIWDINKDGKVDSTDLNLVGNNYGKCPI